MADTKISDLTALTLIATGDLIVTVDISDTTMSASGTDKKITWGSLMAAPGAIGATTPAAGNFTTLVATTLLSAPEGNIVSTPGLTIGYADTGLASNTQNLGFYESGVLAIIISDIIKTVRIPSDYFVSWSSGTNNLAAADLFLSRPASGVAQLGLTNATADGGLRLGSIQVTSGANTKAGTFTLSSGAVTVNNTSVTANSVVQFTIKTSSGTPDGTTHISATSVGASFSVSGNAGDNSTYNYVIIEVN